MESGEWRVDYNYPYNFFLPFFLFFEILFPTFNYSHKKGNNNIQVPGYREIHFRIYEIRFIKKIDPITCLSGFFQCYLQFTYKIPSGLSILGFRNICAY